jgi:serine/threonine protein kinase
MAILTGTRLGQYEILSALGAGGMGEVYRAHDTKLGRDVAIKILSEAFVADPQRLARFQREARTLASLNHPNIGGIYGVEEAHGATALVLELVEGPTLADRIAEGPLPIDEALAIARQIAGALEAAHEQGIIHRDLKPANVKVREDGTVKVLDFGLAKALEPAGAISAGVSRSPTIPTPAMTQAGMILGTAAYMSPEQARGKTADTRCDIWAFGCVLYEMLTGRCAFAAEDVSLTFAEVMKSEPNWSLLPPLPPVLNTFLRQCLKKDPRQRVQAIGDVRLALEGAFETAVSQAATLAPSSLRRMRVLWIVTAAAVLAVAGLAVPAMRHLRETPASSPLETRLEINTPATDDPLSFALSPDGRQIVFVASSDGAPRLWLRSLAATTAQPLVGTEGATSPFWSPDSRSVGFFADIALKRLDLGGDVPRVLATQGGFRGATWNGDGVILWTNASGSLLRVPATGGQFVTVKTPGQTRYNFPSFLPDGRHFLFTAQGTPDTSGIYLGSLDSPDTHRLTPAETKGVHLSPGWLLWVRAGTLVAQRLDLERPGLIGDPVTLADAVAFDTNSASSAVSVSASGLVAYRSGGGARRQLAWFDRSGKRLGTQGVPDENGLNFPSVSPDGRLVAVSRTVQGNTNIWLLDGTRTSRLTFDAMLDRYPIWSPDGRRIVFTSNRKMMDLYQKSSSGSGAEDLLLESPQAKVPSDWSADGRFLLYMSADLQTGTDLWVLPMQGKRASASSGHPEPADGDTPWEFLKTRFDERQGAFSPDGRWVAYTSNESGRNEIYVRPFARPAASGEAVNAAAGQWQVSTSGGIYPRWRSDGKELYYLGPRGEMMAAPIAATGTTLTPGAPAALFTARIVVAGNERQYDVTREGRFLINTVLDDASAPITLLQNWRPR